MNVPDILSKWRWWLLGGLAMTGIGGWYAFEFQAQQRHAAVSPPVAPSVPLPIQRVSPSITEHNTTVKPNTSVNSTAKNSAKNSVGGGTLLPSSGAATNTVPTTGALPQSEVAGAKAAAPGSAAVNAANSGTDNPAPATQAQPNVPSQPARSAPARVVMKSHPTMQTQPSTYRVHSVPSSKAPSQQAKVIKSAPSAPVATDDLGGNTPPRASKSTFMAEEKVRFGTSAAAPSAQAYAPAQKNTALPAIEPSRISTSPSASGQSIPSTASGGSSSSSVNDSQLPRDEGRP